VSCALQFARGTAPLVDIAGERIKGRIMWKGDPAKSEVFSDIIRSNIRQRAAQDRCSGDYLRPAMSKNSSALEGLRLSFTLDFLVELLSIMGGESLRLTLQWSQRAMIRPGLNDCPSRKFRSCLVKIFMRGGYSSGVSRPGVLDSGCHVAGRAQAELGRGGAERCFCFDGCVLPIMLAEVFHGAAQRAFPKQTRAVRARRRPRFGRPHARGA
jgi:hypothetical protein